MSHIWIPKVSWSKIWTSLKTWERNPWNRAPGRIKLWVETLRAISIAKLVQTNQSIHYKWKSTTPPASRRTLIWTHFSRRRSTSQWVQMLTWPRTITISRSSRWRIRPLIMTTLSSHMILLPRRCRVPSSNRTDKAMRQQMHSITYSGITIRSIRVTLSITRGRSIKPITLIMMTCSFRHRSQLLGRCRMIINRTWCLHTRNLCRCLDSRRSQRTPTTASSAPEPTRPPSTCQVWAASKV